MIAGEAPIPRLVAAGIHVPLRFDVRFVAARTDGLHLFGIRRAFWVVQTDRCEQTGRLNLRKVFGTEVATAKVTGACAD